MVPLDKLVGRDNGFTEHPFAGENVIRIDVSQRRRNCIYNRKSDRVELARQFYGCFTYYGSAYKFAGHTP